MSAPSYPLSIPSSPSNFKTSEWRIVRSVAVSTSPFTFKQQSANFDGAVWTTTVTLPPMKREDAVNWQVFFMQLNGRHGTFLLGDPDARTLRGAETVSPTVSGAHSVGAYDIAIKGATNSITVFKKGDYIQFGSGATSKLHMVVADVTSSGSGTGTVQIEPKLKTALSDDDTITYASPKAVMRMDSNELSWTADELSVYGITFSCTEAI
jgi:hypothetical protein